MESYHYMPFYDWKVIIVARVIVGMLSLRHIYGWHVTIMARFMVGKQPLLPVLWL